MLLYGPPAQQSESEFHGEHRNDRLGRRHVARKDDLRRFHMGNKFEELPLFLTPQQLADVTGEHVNSIRRGISEGRIPADKVNGRWRICRDAIFANTKEGLLFGKKVGE